MLRRGVKIFQNNKIKEREHSNKWDPSERFYKEPLLWGINQGEESHSYQGDPHGECLGTLLWGIKVTVRRGKKLQTINQGEESHSNQGDPHGEF